MNIHIKDIREADCPCDALILPFTEGDAGFYDSIIPPLSKPVKKAFSKEFHAKHNEVLLLPSPEAVRPERVLLVGLGKKNEVSAEKIRQAGGKAATYLRAAGMKKVALSTPAFADLKLSPADFVEGSLLGHYSFKKYLAEKNEKDINSFTILSKAHGTLREEIRWVRTTASSVHLARDLINTPANDMTPARLADIALSMKNKRMSVKVLEKKDALKLGMEVYLSVSKGSKEPPKFIVLEYKGNIEPPLVLIGKSITFDSGGLSLKSADGMEKMKYDMAGGAAVLGIMKAAAELNLPVHLVGILPAAENLPGGSASRPGDIVRSITGKTVEIISTDAEGRLTLADSIGYALRFKPKAIIDIATLTGACAIAFGNEAIAMMGNNRRLMDRMKESSDKTYERVWEMPLFEEYRDYIKSDLADFKNTGGRPGSLMTSAYFLYEFAGKTPWIHLDIAGSAWLDKEKPYIPKGASGIGVRLILNFIKELK